MTEQPHATAADGAATAPVHATQLKAVDAPRLPEQITPEWCRELKEAMHAATWQGVDATAKVLPPELLLGLISRAMAIFKAEPTLIELKSTQQLQDQPAPAGQGNPRQLKDQKVYVIGDTHGQYHDVCRLFEVAGFPEQGGPKFLFNGDFVDRGAWGVETVALLLAWKVALPQVVYLLRGNHESALCTRIYGFLQELAAKYGKSSSKKLHKEVRAMFSLLPLGACVAGATLVLHGGLFRKPPSTAGKKRKARRPGKVLQLGSLDDLRSAYKGGQDPSGETAKTVVAADVLWSDPVLEPGLKTNDSRGVGLVYGPDVTEEFLRANGLRLILRSHEGPDARDQRDDLGPMSEGYTLDHATPAGNLYTVFSAPDYPQFQEVPEEERHKNKAAVAVLAPPDYATPTFLQFEAVLPRPKVEPYYDFTFPSLSDLEEPAASCDGDHSTGPTIDSHGPKHASSCDHSTSTTSAGHEAASAQEAHSSPEHAAAKKKATAGRKRDRQTAADTQPGPADGLVDMQVPAGSSKKGTSEHVSGVSQAVAEQQQVQPGAPALQAAGPLCAPNQQADGAAGSSSQVTEAASTTPPPSAAAAAAGASDQGTVQQQQPAAPAPTPSPAASPPHKRQRTQEGHLLQGAAAGTAPVPVHQEPPAEQIPAVCMVGPGSAAAAAGPCQQQATAVLPAAASATPPPAATAVAASSAVGSGIG